MFEHLREHVVSVAGESMLLCVVTWRQKTPATEDQGSTAAATATDDVPTAGHGPADARGPAPSVGDLRAALTAEQRQHFDLLRRWRSTKARDEGVPSYVILTNRQLTEIARQRPNGRSALAQIDGSATRSSRATV